MFNAMSCFCMHATLAASNILPSAPLAAEPMHHIYELSPVGWVRSEHVLFLRIHSILWLLLANEKEKPFCDISAPLV